MSKKKSLQVKNVLQQYRNTSMVKVDTRQLPENTT